MARVVVVPPGALGLQTAPEPTAPTPTGRRSFWEKFLRPEQTERQKRGESFLWFYMSLRDTARETANLREISLASASLDSTTAERRLPVPLLPDDIWRRLGLLIQYVTDGHFDSRNIRMRDAALEEYRWISGEIKWARFVEMRDSADKRDWNDAVAWVASDRSETEAELLETLGKRIPQHERESNDSYIARLRAIVAAFKTQPRPRVEGLP